MLRNKRILLILILAIALFLIPSICNAADATETTQTSESVTVKWSYELDDSNNIVNLKCTNSSIIAGTVTIPSTIDGYTVIGLGGKGYSDGVFESCSGLTGVTIPNTVTSIGYKAFYECVGLRSITIPDSVTSIGYGAFYKCSGLTSVTLSSKLSSIGSNAFYYCTGLKSITIPDSVTNIGENAFMNCSGLTSLTLSKNLTSIKDRTFENCSGLISVVIPESVTTIEGSYENIYGAFGDCKNLEKVLIPDSVATIGAGAFRDCPKLTIYGNDGQASKTYAEKYEINFDYISNWNKGTTGSDIAAPTVENMYIKYSSVLSYWDSTTNTHNVPTGAQIIIVVNFSEEITGKTAPTLTIKCGVGNNINLTNGTIAGETVSYIYTIKSTDVGQISSVSLTGGNITDIAGNKAELSCPNLYVQYGTKEYAYANGNSATVEQGGNDNQVTLSSIAITKTPTRNTYTEGAVFEKDGMVITATYSDGSTKQITNYTVSPSVALKTTDKKVVISYTENGVTKTVEQKVTVTPKGTTNNNDNNGTGTSTSTGTTSKDNTDKDTTIKNDTKLPQTGVAVLSLAVISLMVVAVISKVKYGSYKDI